MTEFLILHNMDCNNSSVSTYLPLLYTSQKECHSFSYGNGDTFFHDSCLSKENNLAPASQTSFWLPKINASVSSRLMIMLIGEPLSVSTVKYFCHYIHTCLVITNLQSGLRPSFSHHICCMCVNLIHE